MVRVVLDTNVVVSAYLVPTGKPARILSLARFLLALMEVIILVPGAIEVDEVKADPEDNKILACALEGKADFVVSGDHHLTDVGFFRGVSIVNPDTFLAFIAGQS